MIERKKGSGGYRKEAKRRVQIGIAHRITTALSADETKAYLEQKGSPELVRFLLRQHFGLCLHFTQEIDKDTTRYKCLECGMDNPPQYQKYIKEIEDIKHWPRDI